MKLIKTIVAAVAMGGLLFAASCNSGEEKKADETAAKPDSSAVKPAEPIAPAKPSNLVIIKHKVANYAKWLTGYEGHDTARVRFGLHNYVVGRGVKDSNMVIVILKMDDVEQAKAFGALPGLKEAMQKGGVIGKPEVQYLDMQMLDVSPTESPLRMIVSHKVKDYDAWKKEFDSHKQARMDAGLTDRALGYEMGNNKMVTLACVVSDMKKAEDFGASKDLKDKMQAAGVDGPPTIFFYTVAKKY